MSVATGTKDVILMRPWAHRRGAEDLLFASGRINTFERECDEFGEWGESLLSPKASRFATSPDELLTRRTQRAQRTSI